MKNVKEIIDVKVQDPPVLEVSAGSNLRARSLTYFCYDIHISIMLSTLAAVRDLFHWEPVSVKS